VPPVAEALCRFNPIYDQGIQGMSAGAQQARLL
jgi:hypothetical protein